VMNGNISGFSWGVYLTGTGRIENMNISSCLSCINTNQQVIIRHNIVFNCSAWGITVVNGVATENTIYACNYGLYAHGSSVNTNSISNNTNYGLYAWNSVFGNNVIMSNGTDIYSGPAALSLKTNVCTTGSAC